MACLDLLKRIINESSVIVTLGDTITNKELLKPTQNKAYNYYQVGNKLVVYPGKETTKTALAIPYEVGTEQEKMRVTELLNGIGLNGLNWMTYIQENHAGRLGFEHAREFVLADEARILAGAREKSISRHGRDIFDVTAKDIDERLIGDAKIYAAYLL